MNKTIDWWCTGAHTRIDFLPENKRKYVRCPTCGRRLLPSAKHCVGGEFICWAIPPHKIRKTKRKPPTKK